MLRTWQQVLAMVTDTLRELSIHSFGGQGRALKSSPQVFEGVGNGT